MQDTPPYRIHCLTHHLSFLTHSCSSDPSSEPSKPQHLETGLQHPGPPAPCPPPPLPASTAPQPLTMPCMLHAACILHCCSLGLEHAPRLTTCRRPKTRALETHPAPKTWYSVTSSSGRYRSLGPGLVSRGCLCPMFLKLEAGQACGTGSTNNPGLLPLAACCCLLRVEAEQAFDESKTWHGRGHFCNPQPAFTEAAASLNGPSLTS